jgi:hypothetical protein
MALQKDVRVRFRRMQPNDELCTAPSPFTATLTSVQHAKEIPARRVEHDVDLARRGSTVPTFSGGSFLDWPARDMWCLSLLGRWHRPHQLRSVLWVVGVRHAL